MRAAQQLDEILAQTDPRDQSLIERWIRPHPDRTDPADAILAETQVPVYAVVGQVKANGGDLDDAADAYEISREAVEAAIAYYRRHRAAIDARMFTGA